MAHAAVRPVGDGSQRVANLEPGLGKQWGLLAGFWVWRCGGTLGDGVVAGEGSSRLGRRRMGKTEAQKMPYVGAGKGGALRSRVDFSEDAFGAEGKGPSLRSGGIWPSVWVCMCN